QPDVREQLLDPEALAVMREDVSHGRRELRVLDGQGFRGPALDDAAGRDIDGAVGRGAAAHQVVQQGGGLVSDLLVIPGDAGEWRLGEPAGDRVVVDAEHGDVI